MMKKIEMKKQKKFMREKKIRKIRTDGGNSKN